MKRILMVAVYATMPTYGFHNVWNAFNEMDRQMHEMHQHMEQVFTQMAEKTAANKVEAPDYELNMKEKENTVILSMNLPKDIKTENISVSLEDDMLNVLIDHEGKIELKISQNMATISASTIIKHERKDAEGKVHLVSAGSSHMSQTLGLPARVDFQREEPKADLTDGLLTITLAKKAGSQKIQVRSAQPIQALAPVDEESDITK